MLFAFMNQDGRPKGFTCTGPPLMQILIKSDRGSISSAANGKTFPVCKHIIIIEASGVVRLILTWTYLEDKGFLGSNEL
jgi:hypothetical protein